jgi:superfamily II DNA or RNA helicase
MAAGSWRAFERAVARLLVHRGFDWVRMTGGPGDRGSDVIGYARGQYWVVQSKFSLNGVAPGPRVLDEVARAVGEYRANQAILATNAYLSDVRHLREAAEKFQQQVGVRVNVLGRNELLTEWAKLPEDPPQRRQLPMRDYQEEAVRVIKQAEITRPGEQAGAIVAMATGTGKSRVLFEYSRDYLGRHRDRRVMVLCEAIELARQLERASWEVLPKWITTHLWSGGEIPTYGCSASVTFATTDSIKPALGVLVRPEQYSLVIFDEAHHAPAEGNRALLRDMEPSFRLGMTATPWRGDQHLVEQVFGGSGPVFRLSVVDAIRGGYLADVEYVAYDDHIDWEQVKQLSRNGLTIKDLNRLLWVPERENRIAEIVRQRIDEMEKDGIPPRTIVFCRTIDHCEKARIALNAAGVEAAELHSELAKFDVTRRLQQFRDGKLRVLTVVDMLNEGIDVPDVQLIVFNRVTHSRRIFLQQLGRGLRRAPGKDRLVVLDFVADVRRLAELAELEREYGERRVKGVETLHVPEHLVRFAGNELERFATAYLRDVADLDDLTDDLVLFPI